MGWGGGNGPDPSGGLGSPNRQRGGLCGIVSRMENGNSPTSLGVGGGQELAASSRVPTVTPGRGHRLSSLQHVCTRVCEYTCVCVCAHVCVCPSVHVDTPWVTAPHAPCPPAASSCTPPAAGGLLPTAPSPPGPRGAAGTAGAAGLRAGGEAGRWGGCRGCRGCALVPGCGCSASPRGCGAWAEPLPAPMAAAVQVLAAARRWLCVRTGGGELPSHPPHPQAPHPSLLRPPQGLGSAVSTSCQPRLPVPPPRAGMSSLRPQGWVRRLL